MIDPAHSLDRAAEEYERVRPGYPSALLDLLPPDYEAYFESLHPPSLRERWESDPWPMLLARGPFGEVHEDAVDCEQIQDREDVLRANVTWAMRT